MPQPSTGFGEELRKRRLDAGLSLTTLSSAVHYSKAQLSKVERGIKTPSRDLVRLCDAVLQADGALVALAARPVADTPLVQTPDAIDEEEWTMQLSPDGPSWFQPLGRRRVVGAGAASLMRLGMGGPGPVAPSAGAGMLEASRSLFTHYRRLGQSVEPGYLLPGLIAQTHTLRELSVHVDDGTRRDLLALGSRYAEYVGWLMQETGDEHAALWWTQRAVDLAAAGGDHALGGYALVRRALITLYQDDAAQTIALAQRAQSDTLPPRIRGLAAQREAQGHALAGDRDACLRALDRARTLLVRKDGGAETPVIGSMHLPDSVGMVTGWCLVDLGRPREAAEELDRQLALVSRDAVRTQVRYGIRRALAYASEREIGHACAVTEPLLDGVATVRSATVTIDLRRLARLLARHPTHAAVRRLAPRLGTLTRPPTS
ncbi:helix-turn-helix transcriptional regulator [Streptomyces sp. P01-B04]|uniref:helix-turn-helix domain-containing protein n=1 Tax=Streptomyces poriferorum TaxID=2798799 RepID=UPI001C5DB5A3|nr:helix-turn-helix transcriptional regulator [Streptomyces poriferorum]MBW5247463.1 helix-turn-helix transcriptional regulator [Streptomyces poriferorum]MBW5255482.1 helix-turn-helix transcriptional regulator [Streptomyces poriferorum]